MLLLHMKANRYLYSEAREQIQKIKQQILHYLKWLAISKSGSLLATEFRDLNISVAPKKGSILVWKNVLPGTTKVHPLSLHAGRPVTGGEKYAFNLWFRENKFV